MFQIGNLVRGLIFSKFGRSGYTVRRLATPLGVFSVALIFLACSDKSLITELKTQNALYFPFSGCDQAGKFPHLQLTGSMNMYVSLN